MDISYIIPYKPAAASMKTLAVRYKLPLLEGPALSVLGMIPAFKITFVFLKDLDLSTIYP